METILNTVINVMLASWEVLLESSLFVLFGFFVAGLLKGFIPDNFIHRHLGSAKLSGIFKASLFGVPIPLCSCGVIPAAAGLREQGASKGAVASFMVSTPETGVDSVAVTYALLDPVMTVIRPVAAFFTASFTGIFVNLMDGDISSHAMEKKGLPKDYPSYPKSTQCGSGGCSCSTQYPVGQDRTGQAEVAMPVVEGRDDHTDHNHSQGGWREKFKKGMAFAFGDLLNDIGPWLLGGIVLAGIITVYISPAFIEAYLGGGIFSMLIMIALATPLYVCATASTPIAAALAMKGISPGAALVFLLAGPATNVATITVVSRLLGKKTAMIYVGSIMICSLILGLFVNYLYIQLGMDIAGWVQSAGHEQHGIVYITAALVLLTLVARPWFTNLLGTGWNRHGHGEHCDHNHDHCSCHGNCSSH